MGCFYKHMTTPDGEQVISSGWRTAGITNALKNGETCLEQSYSTSVFFFFFLYLGWVSFHNHSRITVLQGKGEDISLTPHYHFHPLHKHLDISGAITAESSSLHIGSTRTRTGNLWFPSASR